MTRYDTALDVRKPALGTIVSMDGYVAGTLLAVVGFDFLLIDMQHAAYSWAEVENLAYRIKPTGCAVFIRTSTTDVGELNMAADLPVTGLMMPNVKSAREAEAAIAAITFPPNGERSVGNVRNSTLQSFDFRERRGPKPGLLIEHIGAVNEIEEIVRIPGLHAICVGPHDLAGSMGIDPDTERGGRPRELIEAIDRVRTVVSAAGIIYWAWVADLENLADELGAGTNAILYSADALLFRAAAREIVVAAQSRMHRE